MVLCLMRVSNACFQCVFPMRVSNACFQCVFPISTHQHGPVLDTCFLRVAYDLFVSFFPFLFRNIASRMNGGQHEHAPVLDACFLRVAYALLCLFSLFFIFYLWCLLFNFCLFFSFLFFLFFLFVRQAAKINLLLCFMPVPYGSHPVPILKS